MITYTSDKTAIGSSETYPRITVNFPGSEPDRIKVFYLLHTRNGTYKQYDHFTDGLLERGFVVARLQSTQHMSDNYFGWDDYELAFEEFRRGLQETEKEIVRWTGDETIKPQLFVGGASQGALVPLFEIYCNAPDLGLFDLQGYIGIIPAIRQDVVRRFLEEISWEAVRFPMFVVTGQNDQFIDRTMELMELCLDKGIAVDHIIHKGMGHEFPETMAAELVQAAEFISSNK